MADIKIFNDDRFGQVRIQIDASGEPLFCASDVCNALGYTNGRDAVSNHVDADDVAKCDIIDKLGRVQTSTFINESGLYSLIFGSKLEAAKDFKKWVTSEVLPSIRKTGQYSVNQNQNQKDINSKHPSTLSLKDKLTWIKETKKLLNLDDHSTLNMMQKIAEPLGLPLPEFVDEKEALSISDLLKNKGIMNAKGKYMSGQEGNKRLHEAGLIEQVTRYSRRKGKDVPQWVITKKGNKYGKMHQHKDASFPSPVWYVNTSDELMELLSLSNAGGQPYEN